MGKAARRRAGMRKAAIFTAANAGQPGETFWVPPELTQPDDELFVEHVDGSHEWAVISIHRMTDEQCLDVHRDIRRGPGVVLGHQSLAGVQGPLCLVCEQPWVKVHSQPCPGDPENARAAS